MRPNDRKAELVRKGLNMSGIARLCGVTPSHARAVVIGERRSPRVEAAIAEVIGKPVEEVFPPADAPLAISA